MRMRFDYSGSSTTTSSTSTTTSSTNSYTKAAASGAATGAAREAMTQKKIYDAKTSVSLKAADLTGQTTPRVSQPDYLRASLKGAGVGALVGIATQYAKDAYIPAFQQGGWGGVLSKVLQDATLFRYYPVQK